MGERLARWFILRRRNRLPDWWGSCGNRLCPCWDPLKTPCDEFMGWDGVKKKCARCGLLEPMHVTAGEGKATMGTSDEAPQRRLGLRLDLGADDLASLSHALHVIANDLEYEGAETRQVTSGGYDSGYFLTLTCQPDVTGDSFRADNAAWVKARRASGGGGDE